MCFASVWSGLGSRGDLAQLLLELGRPGASLEVDAVGPDAPTALELFGALAAAVGSRALVRAPGLSSKPPVRRGCAAGFSSILHF